MMKKNILALFRITIALCVFEQHTSKAQGNVQDECFDVTITTTEYGGENSWSIGSCLSSQAYTSDSYFSQQCCLSLGSYTLSCKDSYGDGWHGGYIEFGGQRYCDDFTWGGEKNIQVNAGGATVDATTTAAATTTQPEITTNTIGFSGDPCANYCFHDGVCELVDDNPICECTAGFGGAQCGINYLEYDGLCTAQRYIDRDYSFDWSSQGTATACLDWCIELKRYYSDADLVGCEYEGTTCRMIEDEFGVWVRPFVTGGDGSTNSLCWALISDQLCRDHLPVMWQCDGEDNCGDNSDEEPDYCASRECPSGYFRCSDHRCIYDSWVDDGEGDCPLCEDESDEDVCPHLWYSIWDDWMGNYGGWRK